MREIKFRGRDVETGKLVYGDFVHYVPMSTFPGIVNEDGFVTQINPDSVAQLVGHDANGAEVYEGDSVNIDGKEYTGVILRACPNVEFGEVVKCEK